MKRRTVMFPDEVDARLRLEARRRGVPVAQVVREAVEHHLPASEPRRPLSFSQSGKVGRRMLPRSGSMSSSAARSADAVAADPRGEARPVAGPRPVIACASWQDRVVHVIRATERRARLARRHHLAAEAPAADAVALAERLVGLHASDPATVFLAARARIPGFVAADLETAMYEQGALRKHLAMRRTLFVFPTELIPVVQAACTDAVLATERKRLVKDVEQHGIASDGTRWLARAERDTLRALARGDATGAELSKAVPELRAKISIGEGRSWAADIGMTGRVLTVLAAGGRIVRGRPTGSWTSSRHRWTLAGDGSIPAMPEPDAQIELVRRWLKAFGPATMADLTWWTGLGVTKIRAATAALGVVEVDLEGEPGVVLSDDVGPVPPVAPWTAFLPSLDPTTMGWKRRDWYLGEHAPSLFDSSGNAGPTVWWDGRVVGGWTQRPSGEVVYQLLEDVGAEAITAIDTEAARLGEWLGATVVTTRFPAPVDRGLRA